MKNSANRIEKELFVIFCVLLGVTVSANAKDYKLKDFSIKDVETRCQKVHGEFIAHDDGSYGCTYSKGTVSCNAEQHCIGHLKEHHKAYKIRPKPHYYPHYNHWYQW